MLKVSNYISFCYISFIYFFFLCSYYIVFIIVMFFVIFILFSNDYILIRLEGNVEVGNPTQYLLFGNGRCKRLFFTIYLFFCSGCNDTFLNNGHMCITCVLRQYTY